LIEHLVILVLLATKVGAFEEEYRGDGLVDEILAKVDSSEWEHVREQSDHQSNFGGSGQRNFLFNFFNERSSIVNDAGSCLQRWFRQKEEENQGHD
jgi:hypothetical protein